MTAEEILCLSYFDSIIGPSIFYCSNESKFDEFEHPNLKRILEFNEEEGTIIFAFRKYQTINHVFFMDSDLARGGKELLMITYMIKASYFKNEIVDVFKYLDLKDPILKEFASEIKKLKQLTEIFHVKKTEGDYQNMLQLGSNEFIKKFLNLFNNYFKKLLLGNDKLKPSYSQKNLKKIFIFGARGVGKSTFLKNLESVQFYKQENRDLPSQIYEIVIDNLRIITNDCYEREFDCFLCNNLGGCIQGAQGFIIIFDASDKHSLIGVKKKMYSLKMCMIQSIRLI
ncbi:MAG: hypothetical protein P8Y70_16255 [Candidatus Lokiarchaeota archaeon]